MDLNVLKRKTLTYIRTDKFVFCQDFERATKQNLISILYYKAPKDNDGFFLVYSP